MTRVYLCSEVFMYIPLFFLKVKMIKIIFTRDLNGLGTKRDALKDFCVSFVSTFCSRVASCEYYFLFVI